MVSWAHRRPATGHTDADLLGLLATAMEVHDPVPAGLAERLVMAVATAEVHDEVARIVSSEHPVAAVRSGGTEEARTVTFAADSLTIMVALAPDGPGKVRMDGWIAPAGRMSVAVLVPGETRQVTSDDTGRFVLEGIPRGGVALEVSTTGPGRGPVVRTPTIQV